ncbi:MAG: hypothetical protein AB7O62_22355 [Pirellulales bacterium]
MGRLVIGIVSLLAVGCTHVQLRRNTIHQAQTVADIYQQQVMDNLARFAYDFDSLPHFSVAVTGASQVTDSGSLSYTIQWMGNLVTNTLNPTVQRQAQESWTLSPISGPRRLELMRCAYQTAIAPCIQRGRSENCPGCSRAFNCFYMGDPQIEVPEPNENGFITSKCIDPGICWLGAGPKKCIPRTCGCSLVGHFCGTYVWLLPGGQEELSKLTIAILDYAIKDPAPPPIIPSKSVVVYLDEYGLPTTKDQATTEVSAIIPLNRPSSEVVAADRRDDAAAHIKKRIDQIDAQIRSHSIDGDTLRLFQKQFWTQEEMERASEVSPEDQRKAREVLDLNKEREKLRQLQDRLRASPPSTSAEPVVPRPTYLPERTTSEVPGFSSNLLLLRQQLQTVTPVPTR